MADHAGGHSLLDEIRADPAAVFNQKWISVDPTSDPVLATYFLFHDVDLATQRWALARYGRSYPRACTASGSFWQAASEVAGRRMAVQPT